MRKSSAKSAAQLEFSYSATEPHAPPNSSATEVDEVHAPRDGASGGALGISKFGVSDELYAVTARRAGRLNAASVSQAEHERLLRERQLLLDKKLSGQITPRENNKLEYVRWSLDRIEDAKYGAHLDALDDAVSRYERFIAEVDDLKQQLTARTSQRRR